MLVTVIIPSAGRRPKLLERAIKSALIDNDEIQTEIIVILNGKNGMLFDESTSFQHSLVKYYKLEEGNVSKARNYGLSIAQGELIRFLDDDDYLISNIAFIQYLDFLKNKELEVSVYSICIEDENSNIIDFVYPNFNNNDDFTGYVLSPNLALPFICVYKASLLNTAFWDEECKLPEDEDWMRRVAKIKEINFKYSRDIVGVWFQHTGDRLSYIIANNEFYQNRYFSIRSLINELSNNNRIIRYSQASKGIWSCIHGGFYFTPIYWTKIGLYARTLDPNSRPSDPFFQKLPNWIHPLIIEWLMLPKRWMNHQFRQLKYKLGCSSYIRKI